MVEQTPCRLPAVNATRGPLSHTLLTLTKHPACIAFVLGLLCATGLPPSNAWWATPVALTGFLLLLCRQSTTSLFLHVFAFALGHKLIGLFWLFEAVAIAGEHALLSVPVLGLGLLPIAIHALTCAAVLSAGLLLNRGLSVSRNGMASTSTPFTGLVLIVVLPCLWGIYEWIMTWAYFGGLPMSFLGYSQLQGPLSGVVPVVGTIGLSALTISACGSVAWALTVTPRSLTGAATRLLPVFSIVAAAALLDRIAWTTPANEPLSAVVLTVQFDPRAKRTPDTVIMPIARALDNEDLGKADILFLPETTFTEGITDSERLLMGDALAEAFGGVPMLVGFPYETNGKKYNAVGTLSAPHTTYMKRRLVPVYEYLPFPVTARWRGFLGADKHYDAGAEQQAPVSVAGNLLAVAVCFEAAFPALMAESLHNAGLLFIPSSDSWSSSAQGRAQMLQLAQARAIEFGRPVVRSAVNGVSAVIDQHGHIQQQSRSSNKLIVEDVYPTRGRTPFAAIGQAGIVAILFLALCISFLYCRARARSRWTTTPASP